MDGKTSQVAAVLVEPIIVRGLGAVSILGAVAFLIAGLHLIALYLFLSGAAFLISSLRWGRRYENVAASPPEGFRPTGEVYANPGGDGPVAVYFKGIKRIYVKVSQ